MFAEEKLIGSRCPFKVGDQHYVPISESKTIVSEVYHVTPEIGEALSRSADGKHKFRCYAYGWSQEALEKMPKTLGYPNLQTVERNIFYIDQGNGILT